MVDDTISGFANTDLLSAGADVLLTSLTKSFSGYADVMGGSLVVNPRTSHKAFKPALAARHKNQLFAGDAAKLLSNSADYLSRVALSDRNTAALASAAASHLASTPRTTLTKVHHPTTSGAAFLANYTRWMRPATAEFTPGHGCLLSLDFDTLPAAISFYDALWTPDGPATPIFHGPHLGAHRTIALPYSALTLGGHGEEADAKAASWGCREAQVRIAPGLEGEDGLVETVRAALKVADGSGEAGPA